MAARVKRAAECEYRLRSSYFPDPSPLPQLPGGKETLLGPSVLPRASPTLYSQELLIRGPTGVELGIGLQSKARILETQIQGKRACSLNKTPLSCSAARLPPAPQTWKSSLTSGGRSGSMPPSRACRRLLLVCFMLCTWEGKSREGHQTPRQEAINSNPHTALYLIAHNHSVGETQGFAPFQRLALFIF